MIQRLPQSVINKIAAGEVVQRPAAALKEMLENSIDAESTSIQIVCDEGGLGVLQITDDGSGVNKADLPLLCERFATSKLRCFEDLRAIRTFGFRGEALASISHVAKVVVTTMRRDDPSGHGWSARYVDGVLQQDPQPIATTPGTTIRVEDMYYNSSGRRKALGKASEEYSRIVDVVAKYALCYPCVGFSVKRLEQSKVDAVFPKASTTLANIKSWFGNAVGSHLHPITLAPADLNTAAALSSSSSVAPPDFGVEGFAGAGYVSDVGLVAKKTQLILFVNGRLVDSASVRRCVEQSYASFAVNGNKPFVMLSVTVDPQRIDVNVHPTKHEVWLLDEDGITRALSAAITGKLRERLAHQQQAAGRTDPQNLMSIASSSSNVATTGHKGVVVAPCTVTRVEPQAGALLKHLVKVDPFQCFDRIEKCNSRTDDIQAKVSKETETCNVDDDDDGDDDDDDDAESSSSSSSSDVKIDSLPDGMNDSLVTGRIMGVEAKPVAPFKLPPFAIGDADDDDDACDDLQADFKRRRMEPAPPPLPPPPPPAQGDGSLSLGDALATIASERAGVRNNPSSEDTASFPLPADQPIAASTALFSVAEIQKRLEDASSPALAQVLSTLSLVGIVSPAKFLAQSGTTLYMCDVMKLARHVVYQRIFLHWRSHPVQLFDPNGAPTIPEMLRFALVNGDVKKKGGLEVSEDVDREVAKSWSVLSSWGPMLDEYFGITLNTSTCTVQALPLVLGESWPIPQRMVPLFLWNLSRCVDFSNESTCFLGIAKELANTLFGTLPPHGIHLSDDGGGGGGGQGGPAASTQSPELDAGGKMYDAVRFGLLPRVSATAKHFLPPVELSVDGSLVPVVSVEALYKVFERC